VDVARVPVADIFSAFWRLFHAHDCCAAPSFHGLMDFCESGSNGTFDGCRLTPVVTSPGNCDKVISVRFAIQVQGMESLMVAMPSFGFNKKATHRAAFFPDPFSNAMEGRKEGRSCST